MKVTVSRASSHAPERETRSKDDTLKRRAPFSHTPTLTEYRSPAASVSVSRVKEARTVPLLPMRLSDTNAVPAWERE